MKSRLNMKEAAFNNKLFHRLKNNEFKKVSFLFGAGISISAGLCDFRSKQGI